jgi:hypothetical protein
VILARVSLSDSRKLVVGGLFAADTARSGCSGGWRLEVEGWRLEVEVGGKRETATAGGKGEKSRQGRSSAALRINRQHGEMPFQCETFCGFLCN